MITFMFILTFSAVIPLPSSGEIGEHDALCGPGDSCYALFYQRRGFLESWRACRERGGNLATVKSDQEAALVEQLLTSSSKSRGDVDQLQLRFWIGLQRQPRQCAPQKPLRGFTWTTGDQDTAFTNWALQPVSLGPPGSCSAPRCVAIGLGYGKPEDDFKWLEGTCTLPVDGFVCKFRYQGMCPALSEGSVRYSVPFGYHGTWLDRLPFGSVAAVSCERQKQDVSVLCMLKEDGTVGWNVNEPLCHTAPSQCSKCQQLCGEGGVCACHEGYTLQLDGHSCEPDDDMSFEDHDRVNGCPCQYRCLDLEKGKGYQCICPEGYQLAADGHHCEDIDECEEGDEGPCEHSCQNTPGSYVCSCDLGFSVLEDDPSRCVDVDECQIARVCQQMCVNYVGGFECFCSEGYELDADGVTCKLIGHTENRYAPEAPFSTSEERIEEEDEVWYEGGMEEESFLTQWGMSETATEGSKERWDSRDNAKREYGLTGEVESWGATVQPEVEVIIDTTMSPLDKWEEVTYPVVPVTHKQHGIINHPFPWDEEEKKKEEEEGDSVVFTTIWPAQNTLAADTYDSEKTTDFPTTSMSSSTASSDLADITSEFPTEKVSVTEVTEEEITFANPLTENTECSTCSLKSTKDPTSLDQKKNINHPPTTLGLNVEIDNSLTTIPLPGHQLNNSEVETPLLSTFSPLPPQETKSRRDNRWLIVALLVPLCVFLVIMLALGIVYCTRCGGETKPRSVSDCYHWVTGGGPEKGLAPTGGETQCTQAAV
ncbi:hypothetical protein XENTR_v10011265 [Xenopus tropicalis]|uniref:CD248 molecule n=1 Tax=Xenopus tropicalis TaxID=8364 RepID=A0A803KD80_XENTR|nr:endosialin [Xenopus tropicalis]KAE8607730.1 hypothetical protein XENTR_v10011265 [Xenopus tropicalis]|eukprot:XP_004913746.1 PREDICTED: endosialin [Xenopus tropicalis]